MSCGTDHNNNIIGASQATNGPAATGGVVMPEQCPACGGFLTNERVCHQCNGTARRLDKGKAGQLKLAASQAMSVGDLERLRAKVAAEAPLYRVEDVQFQLQVIDEAAAELASRQATEPDRCPKCGQPLKAGVCQSLQCMPLPRYESRSMKGMPRSMLHQATITEGPYAGLTAIANHPDDLDREIRDAIGRYQAGVALALNTMAEHPSGESAQAAIGAYRPDAADLPPVMPGDLKAIGLMALKITERVSKSHRLGPMAAAYTEAAIKQGGLKQYEADPTSQSSREFARQALELGAAVCEANGARHCPVCGNFVNAHGEGHKPQCGIEGKPVQCPKCDGELTSAGACDNPACGVGLTVLDMNAQMRAELAHEAELEADYERQVAYEQQAAKGQARIEQAVLSAGCPFTSEVILPEPVADLEEITTVGQARELAQRYPDQVKLVETEGVGQHKGKRYVRVEISGQVRVKGCLWDKAKTVSPVANDDKAELRWKTSFISDVQHLADLYADHQEARSKYPDLAAQADALYGELTKHKWWDGSGRQPHKVWLMLFDRLKHRVTGGPAPEPRLYSSRIGQMLHETFGVDRWDEVAGVSQCPKCGNFISPKGEGHKPTCGQLEIEPDEPQAAQATAPAVAQDEAKAEAKPIYIDARRDLLRDGLQVDATNDKELGDITRKHFKTPVYITGSLYNRIFERGDPLSAWNYVCFLAGIAGRVNGDASKIRFPIWLGGKKYTVVAQMGPMEYNDPRPAMTMMFPQDDVSGSEVAQWGDRDTSEGPVDRAQEETSPEAIGRRQIEGLRPYKEWAENVRYSRHADGTVALFDEAGDLRQWLSPSDFDRLKDDPDTLGRAIHTEMVNAALNMGVPLDDAVLADYPDLAVRRCVECGNFLDKQGRGHKPTCGQLSTDATPVEQPAPPQPAATPAPARAQVEEWAPFAPNAQGYMRRDVQGLHPGYFVADWGKGGLHVIESKRGATQAIVKPATRPNTWQFWYPTSDGRFARNGNEFDTPQEALRHFNHYRQIIERPYTVPLAEYERCGGKVQGHLNSLMEALQAGQPVAAKVIAGYQKSSDYPQAYARIFELYGKRRCLKCGNFIGVDGSGHNPACGIDWSGYDSFAEMQEELADKSGDGWRLTEITLKPTHGHLGMGGWERRASADTSCPPVEYTEPTVKLTDRYPTGGRYPGDREHPAALYEVSLPIAPDEPIDDAINRCIDHLEDTEVDERQGESLATGAIIQQFAGGKLWITTEIEYVGNH